MADFLYANSGLCGGTPGSPRGPLGAMPSYLQPTAPTQIPQGVLWFDNASSPYTLSRWNGLSFDPITLAGSGSGSYTPPNLVGVNSLTTVAGSPFSVALGTYGQAFSLSSSTGQPTFNFLSTAGIVTSSSSGVLASASSVNPAFLGSGVASASTYLRGDGTWQTIAAGGNVVSSGSPSSGQIASWVSPTGIQGLAANSLADSVLGLASNGVVKRMGANTYTNAAAGTDYAPPTSGGSILYGNGSGGFSPVTVSTGLAFTGGVLTATGVGSGTVTSFSSGNLSPLFTASVATATTTPALSFALSNAAAGTLFGNTSGSSAAPGFSSASAYADLVLGVSTSGFVKRTGANTYSIDGSTYLTGITSSMVTTALGYTPPTPTGTGASGSWSINAATATTLVTARAINGVNFDGSAAITVTAAAGTLSGSALATGVTSAPGLLSAAGGAFGTGAYASTYSLPTASTSVLGGVKVDGSTITINGSGVISSAGGSIGNSITFTGGSSITDNGSGAMTLNALTAKTLSLNVAGTTALSFSNASSTSAYGLVPYPAKSDYWYNLTNFVGASYSSLSYPDVNAVTSAHMYGVLNYVDGSLSNALGGLFFGQTFAGNGLLLCTPSADSGLLLGSNRVILSTNNVFSGAGGDINIIPGTISINSQLSLKNPLLPQSAGSGVDLGTSTAYFGNAYVQGVYVKSGSNAKAGTFTLTSGAATVANSSITANSVIRFSVKTVSGTIGAAYVSSITAGTGFTVAGLTTDNSTYNYIVEEIN